MTPLVQPGYNSLELRISLLDELALSLEAAQAALLKSNLPVLESQTAKQLSLCRELQEEKPAAVGDSALGAANYDERRQALETQARMLEERVRKLSLIHASLLRRAQRSLAVLRHIVASQCPTYRPEVAIPRLAEGEK